MLSKSLNRNKHTFFTIMKKLIVIIIALMAGGSSFAQSKRIECRHDFRIGIGTPTPKTIITDKPGRHFLTHRFFMSIMVIKLSRG